jgi:hypothetical protein
VDFARVLREVAGALQGERVPFALIGGFALAALGVPRTTGDVDFLVEGARADDVERLVQGLGYETLFRSDDVANFVGRQASAGRVDVLWARREYARAMLARARLHPVGTLSLPVVEAEDLIGLKVQSSSNESRRFALDVADIERLLRATPGLDLARVREYFRLFDREAELDALLARVRGA